MISSAVSAVSIRQWNERNPALTQLDIDIKFLLFINALRHYNFHTTIKSARLQLYAVRAKMIIKRLCEVLEGDREMLLLSEEIRHQHELELTHATKEGKNEVLVRRRLICDYLASSD